MTPVFQVPPVLQVPPRVRDICAKLSLFANPVTYLLFQKFMYIYVGVKTKTKRDKNKFPPRNPLLQKKRRERLVQTANYVYSLLLI